MMQDLKQHPYFKQASLMLEALPFVAEENDFALKGGTAINFFFHDMPRLSVDIDLTYLPIEDRTTSLTNISNALKRIASKFHNANPRSLIQEGLVNGTDLASKLFISNQETQIIIEPNLTLRGVFFPSKKLRTVKAVEDAFSASVAIQVASKADVYGGKICAALDRQHPRDLFDVKILLENEGLTKEILRGFVLYLAGHDETMSQLLDPPMKNISAIYAKEFDGMTSSKIPLKELVATRDKLVMAVQDGLSEDEREFLISLKSMEPKWELMGIVNLETYPAIQWKLQNIRKMEKNHHKKSVNRLKKILGR